MPVSLLVDDLPSLPESLPDGSLLFRVALPAQEIRIISGSARPVDFGHPVDQRRLGVAFSWEQGGERIDAPIDSSAFIDGFEALDNYAADLKARGGDGGNVGRVLVHLSAQLLD